MVLSMDYNVIIDHYYGAEEDRQLKDLLLLHSRQVCELALDVCNRHPELNADKELIEAGAMLHDIGIIRCNAPGIYCYGTEPYIRHGLMGAEMISLFYEAQTDVPPLAEKVKRICARHTGTGLPGLEPETTEEIIVCYADKFFSKTHPERQKTFEEAMHSLEKFGEEGLVIFSKWHERFK